MLSIVHPPEIEYNICCTGSVKLYTTYSVYPMSGVWPILTRSIIFREPQWVKIVLSHIQCNTKGIGENWVNFVLHI
jgi:hypothetical protein